MAEQNGKRYQPEFKARAVQLFRAGRSISSLAKEFKLTTTTIRSAFAAEGPETPRISSRLDPAPASLTPDRPHASFPIGEIGGLFS
jgi:transposase-like protein